LPIVQQGAIRSRAEIACTHQARGDGARIDGLSDGGTIDGSRGDHVLLAPPFIADAAAIDAIVERLGDAIDASVPDGAQVPVLR
jgi:adenosylmethionine-8-amino-7-oxononanoate aminotransferase